MGCETFNYQPEGVDKADNIRLGGSILISCRDLARLGQLYLNKGRWAGRQLVDADYIREAITPVAAQRRLRLSLVAEPRRPHAERADVDVHAAGARGQFCFVLPEHDMVIATMGFGDSTAIRRRCLGSARPCASRTIHEGSADESPRSRADAGVACWRLARRDAGRRAAPLACRQPQALSSARRRRRLTRSRACPTPSRRWAHLRWAPPQPMSWTGEREATEFGLPCLQPTNADGRPNGAALPAHRSEDCLYLNVWAPAERAERADHAVALWRRRHDGRRHVSTYDGGAFARDGVVLVTINYRHGALAGFAHPGHRSSERIGGCQLPPARRHRGA